jgi:hypothetical protein
MILVGWKPPPHGWVKFNSNGSCRENGITGCDGIIKRSDGDRVLGWFC